MTKIVLNDLASLTNEQSALTLLNQNSSIIETASDNFLSRDGTTPNHMLADLDMNSNHILNLPQPVDATEPLRLQDLADFNNLGSITTGAPATASFVTLGTNSILTNERVLVAGTGISLTDGGANGNLTVATSPTTGTGNVVFATSPTITTPTISSANLTGVPVAPTAAVGTNTTQLATTAFVRSELLFINVKDYGALGNDSANDSTAIQNALNAASGGGIVFFPPGIYQCSGLSIPGEAVLMGAGSVAGNAFGGNVSVLKLPNSSASNTFIAAGSTYINNDAFSNGGQALYHISFDGNKANQANDQDLLILRCFRAKVHNCEFFNSRRHGCVLSAKSANSTATNGVAECEWVNCNFYDNDGAGWYGADDSGNHLADWFVRGCNFAFNGGRLSNYNLEAERSAGCHIIDNQMYGSPIGNIYCKLGGIMHITANHLDTTDSNNTTNNVRIDVSGFGNVIVNGNLFWDNDATTTGKVHLALVKGSVSFMSIAVTANSFVYGTGTTGAALSFTSFAAGDREVMIFSGNHYFPFNIIPTHEHATFGVKMKAVDETTNTDITLSNDNTLTFDMLANTKYSFRAKVYYDTPTAADFKWRHTGPASPTLVNIKRSSIAPGATAFGNIAFDTAYSAADIVITETSGTAGYIEFEGTIHNGTNAGTFAFQWAQNTSNGSNTTVRAGSYLQYSLVI